MATWYTLYAWSARAEKVEVSKCTEKFVTLSSGQRVARITDTQVYFPTKKECWDWLVAREKTRVACAKEQLEYREKVLVDVEDYAAEDLAGQTAPRIRT